MSTKDFVELVEAFAIAVQGWAKAIQNDEKSGFAIMATLDAVENLDKARADLFQAYEARVPSSHSEDFPGMFEEYEKAALTGLLVGVHVDDCSEDEMAEWAEKQAAACMKRYEARKAREVKAC